MREVIKRGGMARSVCSVLIGISLALAVPLHAMDQPVHAPAAPADTHAAARAELWQLVEAFKHAMLLKDGGAIRGMFLPGGSWFKVLDPVALAAARTKSPEAKQLSPGSYEDLAKFLTTTPAAIEETFEKVHIETDGTVGMVWFDYRFISDGKQDHHGVETWQVVRGSDGWKISAMLYSVSPG
jgi:hypothetical protein